MLRLNLRARDRFGSLTVTAALQAQSIVLPGHRIVYKS